MEFKLSNDYLQAEKRRFRKINIIHLLWVLIFALAIYIHFYNSSVLKNYFIWSIALLVCSEILFVINLPWQNKFVKRMIDEYKISINEDEIISTIPNPYYLDSIINVKINKNEIIGINETKYGIDILTNEDDRKINIDKRIQNYLEIKNKLNEFMEIEAVTSEKMSMLLKAFMMYPYLLYSLILFSSFLMKIYLIIKTIGVVKSFFNMIVARSFSKTMKKRTEIS